MFPSSDYDKSRKFRAWSVRDNTMGLVKVITIGVGAFIIGIPPGPDVVDAERKITIFAPADGRFVSMNDLFLMSFTGLLDRQLREIWEGDIIDYWSSIHGNKRGVVVFQKGSFYLSAYNWREILGMISSDSDTTGLSVIGNIYEHPHLRQGF